MKMLYERKLEDKGFPEITFVYETSDVEELQKLPDTFRIIKEDTTTGKFTIEDLKMPGREITLGGYEIIQQYVAPMLAQDSMFNFFSSINQVSATMVSIVFGDATQKGEKIEFKTSTQPFHVMVTVRWGGFTSNDITDVEWLGKYESDSTVIYNKTYKSGSAVFDNETMFIIELPEFYLGGMEFLEDIEIVR